MTLRARHEMIELRGADLRFTEDEAATFLASALGGRLTAEAMHLLTEKTEGWAVGLRLAALSIRDSKDATQFIEHLGAAHGGLVLEYLMSEVLANATPAMRDFLLKTSILDQFSPELCAAVWDDAESLVDVEDRINELVRANLFVISIDGEHRWWRYHHLFQDLLRHELRRQLATEEINDLHHRASVWFAKRDLVDEALHHALAAGDIDGATQLIEQNRQAIVNADQWYVLEKWLSRLPDGVKRQKPELMLAEAWVLQFQLALSALISLMDTIEKTLENAEVESAIWGEIEFFRGLQWFFMGDGARSLACLRRAQEQLPQQYQLARGLTQTYLGLATQMKGQKDTAIKTLQQQLYHRDRRHHVNETRLRGSLVFIHFLAGGLTEAAWEIEQTKRTVLENNNLFIGTWCSYFQAYIHFFRGELDQAVGLFEQAVNNRYIMHARSAIDSLAGCALTYQALGQSQKANETMELLLEFAQQSNDPAKVTIAFSCQARLALQQGDLASAIKWLQMADLTTDVGIMFSWIEIPRVTQCRMLIVQETAASLQEAAEKLQQYEQENEAAHNTRQLIEILPLLATTHLKQGRDQEALDTLERAVTLAEPDGWIRPFLELEPGMAALLNKLGQRGVAPVFIARIVDALPLSLSSITAANQSRLPEPLTDREMDVLMLLAQRYRDKEIAAELFISPTTVKRHASNIYQKLQVNGRRQAVEKAIALGVLPSSV